MIMGNGGLGDTNGSIGAWYLNEGYVDFPPGE